MAIIKQDGKTIAVTPVSNLSHWLEENGLDKADLEITLTSKEVSAAIRKGVHESIGDAGSREGKMKDVLDITAVHLLVEIAVCGENPSNDADRMRFQLLQELAGDADILAFAKDRLAKIKAGEILLSAPAKPGGVTGALDEAFEASTSFVQLLKSARA